VNNLAAHEACHGLSDRCSAAAGVHSIHAGTFDHQSCMIVAVDKGFGSDRIPAAFMEVRIVLDDGYQRYPATGDSLNLKRERLNAATIASP
jgi:hypothetical protein